MFPVLQILFKKKKGTGAARTSQADLEERRYLDESMEQARKLATGQHRMNNLRPNIAPPIVKIV